MSNQTTRTSAGPIIDSIDKRPGRTIQLNPNGEIVDVSEDHADSPPIKAGFLQHLASLAQALKPGQVARATVSTFEIVTQAPPPPPAPNPTPSSNTKVVAVVPRRATLELPKARKTPIGRATVLRVLEIAARDYELGDCPWPPPAYLDVRKKPDGTTMVALLDPTTGFKQGWTVCPETHKPKHLGWVNE
ncbi:hypothetical protein QA648_36845 (plasmid) [Rhizobium sp. CB3171]|uniref:hypothetical protein n=1 Tax=Rhizobium sp. CB3171 TaxID=3039157 RepID=UPI0024B125AF|nr:hypothetical protein [Rhizobium sp. CB3171]WFU07548.1 hypothetical protein QA648_36845 [Rhizobium sp. CB3171]